MDAKHSDIRTLNLAQLSQGEEWRVKLLHGRPYHLLIWLTRGQGLMLLDGMRRGLGAHNAVFIPSDSLFSLDLGRQCALQAIAFPDATPLRLPQQPLLLRIRQVQDQSELTALLDITNREELARRPLYHDAVEANAALVSVWLRRQTLLEEHAPERRDAAQRLSNAFCMALAAQYRSGAGMAEYAAQLGVTPTHLTRAVKRATGKTAANLMAERVLYEARTLLFETREPAQQIAKYLGFGSAAYFTRFMRQHTGQVPSQLRQPT